MLPACDRSLPWKPRTAVRGFLLLATAVAVRCPAIAVAGPNAVACLSAASSYRSAPYQRREGVSSGRDSPNMVSLRIVYGRRDRRLSKMPHMIAADWKAVYWPDRRTAVHGHEVVVGRLVHGHSIDDLGI